MIQKPLITETTLRDAQRGVFTFEVTKETTKGQIKDMIEKLFKVHVIKVTTTIKKGKTKRVGRMRRVKDVVKIKKARIMLKKGETIEYFEVQAQATEEPKKVAEKAASK
jgi:large subunit ribosomal protein L23